MGGSQVERCRSRRTYETPVRAHTTTPTAIPHPCLSTFMTREHVFLHRLALVAVGLAVANYPLPLEWVVRGTVGYQHGTASISRKQHAMFSQEGHTN